MSQMRQLQRRCCPAELLSLQLLLDLCVLAGQTLDLCRLAGQVLDLLQPGLQATVLAGVLASLQEQV